MAVGGCDGHFQSPIAVQRNFISKDRPAAEDDDVNVLSVRIGLVAARTNPCVEVIAVSLLPMSLLRSSRTQWLPAGSGSATTASSTSSRGRRRAQARQWAPPCGRGEPTPSRRLRSTAGPQSGGAHGERSAGRAGIPIGAHRRRVREAAQHRHHLLGELRACGHFPLALA